MTAKKTEADVPAQAGPNLYQRLNAVCKEIQPVEKAETHQRLQYKFAGHDSVTAAVRAALLTYGVDQTVSVTSCETLDDKRIRVQCGIIWRNVDNPEETKGVVAFGEGPSPGKGGAQPQHLGSAISYAVKYALMKNFLLVGDDTPDVETYHQGYPERPPIAAPDPAPPAMDEARIASKVAALGVVSTRETFVELVKSISHPSFRGQLTEQQLNGLLEQIEQTDQRLKAQEARQ